ncbi:GGDEF domain-containing protein [Teredinibacter franksiae]|uniref:GGDEF domain-containing protein n=1 Tax=Teredinibacter franksiae TaxID=2761453 RepID=UPI0016256C51|nr:GGDEF domain-containing protein [Teredinibacter franksiae]
MRLGRYAQVRNVALVITLVVLIGHYFLPEKRELLYPSDTGVTQLYGHFDPKTGQSSRWTDEAKSSWTCIFKVTDVVGCGWDVYWDPDISKGKNFGAYEGVEVHMRYSGSATRIRVYMRNHNPVYAVSNKRESGKFLSMTFRVEETITPIRIKLSEFNVADWWITESNVRRQWSSPEFDNITKVGVDFIEFGTHNVEINKVFLVGKWVRTETLFLQIFTFWLSTFLLEGIFRFYSLYKKADHERDLIRELRIREYNMEIEKEDLQELVDRDPLTEALNRNGLESKIKLLYGLDSAFSCYGLMVLDLDYFKRINDAWGHDLGDKVLKMLAVSVQLSLRHGDVLARWGGEEFIVVCPIAEQAPLADFAEKLRLVASECRVEGEPEIVITTSIGVSVAQRGESFDKVFRRADSALYKAKANGRNCVEFEL